NQPSIDIDFESAAAIPQGVNDWTELSGWNAHPMVRTFAVKLQNHFGMSVINYVYSIVSIYGGSHEGKGLYLQDVRMIADQVKVGWGFHLNAKVEVGSVYNCGTTTDPEAAMVLVHRYGVSSIFSHTETMQHFIVRGGGKVELTGGPEGPVRP